MRYLFEAFELDTERYELRCAGEIRALEPQVFDVLAYLVGHCERVVSKQELLDEVWPEGFVTESALTSRLMSARQAVDDSGREQRLIKTLHRRGYRFVGAVEERDEDASEDAGPLAPVRRAAADGSEQRGNLPAQLTSFVGREAELAELGALVAQSRLTTLTGTGGAGKTRLAVQLAGERAAAYEDGVWFIDLAPITDGELVPAEAAAALGVDPEALAGYLRGRSALLIFDNCEQLLDACARTIGSILETASGVDVIATCRELLRVPGEVTYRVPSLRLPDPAERSLAAIAASEAVRLFVDRAAAARPGFAVDATNAEALAQIVERLDGIPLAIELAAARVSALAPSQIADRLSDTFRLLGRGSRTALPRQQTLEATIDWSYEFLSERERLLFDRLSTFRGGFTLEAAAAIVDPARVDEGDVFDTVAQLVDRSLVVTAPGGGELRYRLLEPVRQYAAGKLGRGDDWHDASRRHAEFFSGLLREAEPRLRGAEQVEWLSRLDRDYDNVRAALAWAIDEGDARLALAMCGDLHWFWHVHRDVAQGEGSEWMERAIALAGDVPAGELALAFRAAGFTAVFDGADFARADECLSESLRLSEAEGDSAAVAMAHVYQVFAAVLAYDDAATQTHLEAAVAQLDQNADDWAINKCLMFEGMARSAAEPEAAARLLERSLTMARERGDVHGIAWSSLFLGNLARDRGLLSEAADLYIEARRHFELYGERACVASALAGEGTVTWLQGDPVGGIALHEESLSQLKQCGGSGAFTYLIGVALMSDRLTEEVPELLARLQSRVDVGSEASARDALAEGIQFLATLARRRGDEDRALALEQQHAELSGVAGR